MFFEPKHKHSTTFYRVSVYTIYVQVLADNQILCFQLGSTAIGIQTSEGVVLAVEKRITSPLMEPNSVEKIVEIDSHIGITTSCNVVNTSIKWNLP